MPLINMIEILPHLSKTDSNLKTL